MNLTLKIGQLVRWGNGKSVGLLIGLSGVSAIVYWFRAPSPAISNLKPEAHHQIYINSISG